MARVLSGIPNSLSFLGDLSGSPEGGILNDCNGDENIAFKDYQIRAQARQKISQYREPPKGESFTGLLDVCPFKNKKKGEKR